MEQSAFFRLSPCLNCSFFHFYFNTRNGLAGILGGKNVGTPIPGDRAGSVAVMLDLLSIVRFALSTLLG